MAEETTQQDTTNGTESAASTNPAPTEQATQAAGQIKTGDKDKEKEVQETTNKVLNISTRTAITDIREDIINESFSVQKSNNEKNDEIIDIVTDYSWTIDKFLTNGGVQSDIPFCYLVEYKQSHSTTITNIINTISAATTSIRNVVSNDSVQNALNGIKKLASSLMSTSGEATDAAQSNPQSATDGGAEQAAPGADSNKQSKKTEEPKKEAKTDVGGSIQKVYDTITQSISEVFGGKDAKLNIENGITNSQYLKPYSLLYWLKATNKRYTFPMLSNPPSLTVNNSGAYGDQAQDESGVFGISFTKTLNEAMNVMRKAPAFAKDVQDIASVFFGDGSSGGYHHAGVEKAKFFQYPTDTEEYTISFPLINTVRSIDKIPTWQKNYKFIFLFCLRNMIFRKDNSSFYPPLFYDLSIPGVVRQPFCYVSSISVTPFGMIRQKQYKGADGNGINLLNFRDKPSANLSIPVPEQWHVTIKFKSLLATTANMVLSSIYDTPITASSK